MELRWLDTRFYVTDKAFYLNALLDAHQGVDDLGGRHLEHCFLQAVLAAKVSRFVFSTPPAIAGVSGSSGREAVSGTHSRAARARRLALGWTTNWVTR